MPHREARIFGWQGIGLVAIKLLRERRRELVLTGAVLIVAFFCDRVLRGGEISAQLTQIERGRQVYISEGCINCHSQYVRPNTADDLMWGPVETMQELRQQHPPLIGNRRQGPDLSQVGGRRSPLWLKAHFYDPPEVSGASIMPSYAILFRDQRGDDLVAYLESLHGSGTESHIAMEGQWNPSPDAVARAGADEGELLFHRDCSTCHSANGRTRSEWQGAFYRLPPDLAVGPLRYLSALETRAERMNRLARIAKFGIPGTDMPGHEYLSDKDIASIALWLSKNAAQPAQNK